MQIQYRRRSPRSALAPERGIRHLVPKLIFMTSGPSTYAGRRRAGYEPKNGSELSPKEEPIGSRPSDGQPMAMLVPFRPSLPYRPGRPPTPKISSSSGRSKIVTMPDWDPDRLLRWILAAAIGIGIGSACAVIIVLVITFG